MEQRVSRRKFLYLTSAAAAACTALVTNGGRAVAQEEKEETAASEGELTRVEPGRAAYGDNTYVSPLAEVFGDVFVGTGVFVAGNTVLRAAPERRLEIGDQTNIQDNCVIRSLEEDSSISTETSLAHHAVVRDCEIGDFVFIGFNAEVRNCTIGNGVFIQHGARVENVELAENAYVDVGEVVTTQEQADDLPTAESATEEFRREVLDVNAEFAESYVTLFEEEGYRATIDVGPQPSTSFNPDPVEPQLGDKVRLGEFARVVGDVRIGDGTRVGQRAAIRADEGAPIVIGRGSDIRNRVTFHALKGTDIQIGDALFAGDDAVLHGPLEMGNGVQVGDRAVVFRVSVEDGVNIGESALVVGPASEDGELTLTISAGTVIPDGAIIKSQEDLDELENLRL